MMQANVTYPYNQTQTQFTQQQLTTAVILSISYFFIVIFFKYRPIVVLDDIN